ncbi:MAG: hypothetical protein OYL92_15195 [Acidobacteriota bacterium]|nr:hypothetical protein [Acidobacteriota bacterium]MDE3266312.1 hypothetical protein [Acidobacteriota bacterium]
MTTMRTSGSQDTGGTSSIRRSCLARPAVVLTLMVPAIVVSTSLAAQQGRDLLSWQEPIQDHVFAKEAVRDVVVHDASDLLQVEAAVSDPAGVASAATTAYKYDDGTPEEFTRITNAYDQEYAQRFRLPQAGTVTSATACFGREQTDNNASVSFVLTFYRDSGGRPGSRLASYSATASSLARGRGTCVNVNRGDITRQRLGSGNTWLSVRWQNSSDKFFAEDRNGPGGTRNFWRSRSSSGASWSSWNAETVATAYFIRLSVDHGGGTPPTPDPEPPPPATGCTPTTTALRFDGGYDVSMCYRTPQGEEGQARSGVWASGQAGILWFFDRGNAEVLVKVLDGCAHNGHRWVFVAPVTDLEFNLWVTGPNGKRWTHSNRQGSTASTKSDTRAFRCADEESGGDDNDGDDGDGDGDDDDNNNTGSGTRYNVGDVITTLPSDSWSLNGALSGCSLTTSGGVTNVRCSRNGYVERRPYRYTCDASTCRIEGRIVTAGSWLETR